MRALILLTAITLPACATTAEPRQSVADSPRDWRFAATGNDRERLRDWRDAFKTALDRSRAAGHGADIDREGALLQPDAALGQVPIPNGNYRCRVIKVGAKTAGMLEYVSYPDFACRIRPERGIQGFAKLTGSQRPVGLIFPNDALRQVFLGTLVLGDETRAMQYGRDEERDVAAFVEKIGPNRWRMVMPYPAFESLTDVMELVPAS
ncbi:MAG TPA: DUF4893 domain-containing protein [Sphingomicrobium sp.]|nr:DUF4893 domain-containing protein [Sphingomicrobium sp.]